MIELFDPIKDISRRSIKPLKDGDTYLLGKLMITLEYKKNALKIYRVVILTTYIIN